MDLQKVKEALEDCAELYVLADGIQSFEDFEDGQPSLGTLKNLQIIKESAIKAKSALAELEKPASEDAVNVAKEVFDIPALDFSEWLDIADAIIQQYAESYAAKKCARVRLETLEELLKTLSRVPMSCPGDRYTIQTMLDQRIDAAKKEAVE